MWKNWSGYVECPGTPVRTPDDVAQLAQLLADAARDGTPVRVAGAGPVKAAAGVPPKP